MVSLRQSYGPYFSYHEKIVCILVKNINFVGHFGGHIGFSSRRTSPSNSHCCLFNSGGLIIYKSTPKS